MMPHHTRTMIAVTVALMLQSPVSGLAAQPSSSATSAESTVARSSGPIYQLRLYEIFEHNKAAFHARFRDHALRIMARYDFQMRAMWETRLDGRTEFVYVLEWPDQATLEDRWKRFLADEEWIRIKQESAAAHGTLVGAIEDRALTSLDYGPRLSPASPARKR